MKDWHKLKPELFKKQPYYLPGCDKGPVLEHGQTLGMSEDETFRISRDGPRNLLRLTLETAKTDGADR